MADHSKIEWTESTLNVVTGCTRVSEGCDNCYIERTPPFRMTGRKFDRPGPGGTTGVQLHPERVIQAVRWKRPRRIFLPSLSDLFHQDVPDELIVDVFATAALTPHHTYQITTKRPARMRSLLRGDTWRRRCEDAYARLNWEAYGAGALARHRFESNRDAWWSPFSKPLPNVWLGVSVESQRWADVRVPLLLDTPAAVRWVSAEPLLGPVTLPCRWRVALSCCGDDDGEYVASSWDEADRFRESYTSGPGVNDHGYSGTTSYEHRRAGVLSSTLGIDWVVCGGESGPGARPMHPAWARSLRDQCETAGVPYFFKQWGEHTPYRYPEDDPDIPPTTWVSLDGQVGDDATAVADSGTWSAVYRVGKKRAGRMLDGCTHDEYPAVSR
jgi:protein gp37